jgi:hypothetical protein
MPITKNFAVRKSAWKPKLEQKSGGKKKFARQIFVSYFNKLLG